MLYKWKFNKFSSSFSVCVHFDLLILIYRFWFSDFSVSSSFAFHPRSFDRFSPKIRIKLHTLSTVREMFECDFLILRVIKLLFGEFMEFIVFLRSFCHVNSNEMPSISQRTKVRYFHITQKACFDFSIFTVNLFSCLLLTYAIFVFHVSNNKKSQTDFVQRIFIFAVVVIVGIEAIDVNDQCTRIFFSKIKSKSKSKRKQPKWIPNDRLKYINRQINAQPWVPAPRKVMNITGEKRNCTHYWLVWIEVQSIQRIHAH